MSKIILQSAGKNPDGTPRRPICDVTGYSLASIHRLEKARLFPARLQLGPGKVGWDSISVQTWLESRARGPAPAPHRNAA